MNSAINACREEYKTRIEDHFAGGAKACWQGLKAISGHNKTKAASHEGSPEEWAKELSQFYTRFERPDFVPATSAAQTSPMTDITEEEVRRVFCSVKVHKAAGPDGITPMLLKDCAYYLAPVFCSIFNISLKHRKVPALWKSSIIVPVPKKAKPKVANDFRPVALTSAVMKCLERLILPKVIKQTASSLDPLQFAYKQGRSVEDATTYLIHLVSQHLETARSYVRILFVDFSSAFNTMLPSVLMNKLRVLGVDGSLCEWILDYLHERTQRVRVGDVLSDVASTNIGAPQGCVLSPVLFTLYTNDHRGTEPHTFTVKYADDAAMAGLISNDDETHYRQDIQNFAEQCDSDGLELNVGKTKEMVVDFRRGVHELEPVNIKDTNVSTVAMYDYLGSRIAKDLSWGATIEKSTSKAMQRMYGLRKLKEFKVAQHLQVQFYRSTIESVLLFGISVWGGNVTKKDRRRLNRARKCACKIIGTSLPSWEAEYRKRVKQLGEKITADSTHPLHCQFETLPSGRRIRQIKARTGRLSKSFVPQAITILNA